MSQERTFPLLDAGRTNLVPARIPWAVVEPGRVQAEANHGQTLEILAGRGGLSVLELYAALNQLRLPEIRDVAPGAACMWLRGRLNEFERGRAR